MTNNRRTQTECPKLKDKENLLNMVANKQTIKLHNQKYASSNTIVMDKI